MSDIPKIKPLNIGSVPANTNRAESQSPNTNQQDFSVLNTAKNQMREDSGSTNQAISQFGAEKNLAKNENVLATNISQETNIQSTEQQLLGLNSMSNVQNLKEEIRALKAEALHTPGGLARSLIDLARRKIQEAMEEIKKAKEAFINSGKLQKTSFKEQDISRNAESKARTSDNNLNLAKQQAQDFNNKFSS